MTAFDVFFRCVRASEWVSETAFRVWVGAFFFFSPAVWCGVREGVCVFCLWCFAGVLMESLTPLCFFEKMLGAKASHILHSVPAWLPRKFFFFFGESEHTAQAAHTHKFSRGAAWCVRGKIKWKGNCGGREKEKEKIHQEKEGRIRPQLET